MAVVLVVCCGGVGGNKVDLVAVSVLGLKRSTVVPPLYLYISSCHKAHKALTFSFHPPRFAAKAGNHGRVSEL